MRHKGSKIQFCFCNPDDVNWQINEPSTFISVTKTNEVAIFKVEIIIQDFQLEKISEYEDTSYIQTALAFCFTASSCTREGGR